MDRPIIYADAIPLESDLLKLARDAMVAIARLSQDVLGATTCVGGLACIPAAASPMSVQVGAGSIYSVQNLDNTSYSSLGADTTHQVVKQGILLDPVALSCPAPSTVGFSVDYLIQAIYQDIDANSIVLPYYNASNPTVAFSGPGNSGTAQPTDRQGRIVLQAKSGIAAATGTQSIPSPDAGFVGLWVVTVANGQTSISSGNIVMASGAPFVTTILGIVGNLASVASNSLGAGMVGFGPGQSYPQGSVGARVNSSGHPSETNTLIGFGVFNDDVLSGTVGYRCTAVGALALASNGGSSSAGGSNSAFGYAALHANSDSSGNNAFGAFALNSVTGVGASHNNAFGYQSQQANVSGTQNNSFGFRTLYTLTAGNNNHAFGESALYSLATGNGNHAFGYQALYYKTGGSDFSHAFGYQALISETTGGPNFGAGYQAGYNAGTSQGNTLVGYQAAGSGAPSLGNYNSSFGHQALYSVNATVGTDGQYNSGFGYWSLLRLTTGSSNNCFGEQSGSFITTGNQNTLLGDNAGSGVVTSSGNVVVGSGSLTNMDGGNNTAVGFGAATPGTAQTWANTTTLGNGAQPSGSNQVTLGNTNVTAIRAAVTTITSLSDLRDKTNVASPDATAIPDGFLDLVLTPWMYDWAMRDGTQRPGKQVGVIAQHLKAAQDQFGLQWLGLVDESNPDRLEATPGKLLYLVCLRAQRQQAVIERISARLDALERRAA